MYAIRSYYGNPKLQPARTDGPKPRPSLLEMRQLLHRLFMGEMNDIMECSTPLRDKTLSLWINQVEMHDISQQPPQQPVITSYSIHYTKLYEPATSISSIFCSMVEISFIPPGRRTCSGCGSKVIATLVPPDCLALSTTVANNCRCPQ